MKKFLLILVASFATSFSFAQTELLTNGGFESWTDGVADGWKSASSAGNGTVTQSTDARTGSYAARLATASGNKRMARAEMALVAGEYTFTAWVKNAEAGQAATVALGYTPISEEGTAGQYQYGDQTPVGDEWQQFSYTFTLAEKTTVCLVVFDKKNTADVLIDDASLMGPDQTATPEEPQPAVNYLFTKITSHDQLTADGTYMIAAENEGKVLIAKNLDASKTYGYLQAAEATVKDGKIVTKDLDNTYTFKGSNIIDAQGRMMYMDATHNSFNVAVDAAEGIDWTVTLNADGTVTITNDDVQKTVQYDPNYSSYGSYAEVKGIYPCIYVLSGTEAAEGGDEPEEPEAKIERITVKEFLEKADTENAYELTGVVKTIASTLYGNFYLEQDGSEIYIYGTLDKEGNTKNWESLGVVEGDSIVIQGTYTTYKDAPQIKNAQYVSHKSNGFVPVDISNTPETAYTPAQASQLALAGEGLATSVYVKGIISRIAEISTSYGNASYYISADGTETDELYVFRGYSLEGEKFTSETEIAVGDEVIIYGQLTTYNETPQVNTGSKIYSITKSGADGIGDIKVGRTQKAAYNLAGQRVNRLEPGRIYVVDGKKVMVK
ncbi:MAG: carbohydrate binding domain-containing protein [Bacteroidaceae bacterium]|nr:carbohydrate binding domain-containing protein [Bacteroidaceae bacterium]